jgi:hypothetical protein
MIRTTLRTLLWMVAPVCFCVAALGLSEARADLPTGVSVTPDNAGTVSGAAALMGFVALGGCLVGYRRRSSRDSPFCGSVGVLSEVALERYKIIWLTPNLTQTSQPAWSAASARPEHRTVSVA